MNGGQLDLFGDQDAPAAAQERAAVPPPLPPESSESGKIGGAGLPAAPERAEQRTRAASHGLSTIPPTCPVVNRPVYYWEDCHHFQGRLCSHPDAWRSRPRRRRRQ